MRQAGATAGAARLVAVELRVWSVTQSGGPGGERTG